MEEIPKLKSHNHSMFPWYCKHRNDNWMVGFCLVLVISVNKRKMIFASLTHVIKIWHSRVPNLFASCHAPLRTPCIGRKKENVT